MQVVGIMKSALDAIQHQAVKHGATGVARIVPRPGPPVGADREALRLAYEALSRSIARLESPDL